LLTARTSGWFDPRELGGDEVALPPASAGPDPSDRAAPAGCSPIAIAARRASNVFSDKHDRPQIGSQRFLHGVLGARTAPEDSRSEPT
jgi:hypothetical protein